MVDCTTSNLAGLQSLQLNMAFSDKPLQWLMVILSFVGARPLHCKCRTALHKHCHVEPLIFKEGL